MIFFPSKGVQAWVGKHLHIRDKNSSKGKVVWTSQTIAYKYETLFFYICTNTTTSHDMGKTHKSIKEKNVLKNKNRERMAFSYGFLLQ